MREKEYAFEYAKSAADKFDAERYLNMPRPYPVTLGQKMYGYAMPKQYSMLKDAPYVIPVFRSKELNGETVSKLNPFAASKILLIVSKPTSFSENSLAVLLFSIAS